MTRKFITMFGVAAMTASLALAAAPAKTSTTAKPTRPESAQMRADKQKLARDLDLTDAQKRQLQEIQVRRIQFDKEMRAKMQVKQDEYAALQKAQDPRADSVKSELMAMRKQWMEERQKMADEVRGVLTPEQQQKLDAARASRQANGRG